MLMEFTVPDSAMPKKDPVNPCPCQFRPFQLKGKTGQLHWLAAEGDRVSEGQILCEGEVEKKTIEFPSPCAGILEKICIGEDEAFGCGDVLAFIRTD